jgi:hypothetical protein
MKKIKPLTVAELEKWMKLTNRNQNEAAEYWGFTKGWCSKMMNEKVTPGIPFTRAVRCEMKDLKKSNGSS